MVEWYWQGKTEVLGEKHYEVWVVDEWMSMEQWWNDTDRGKLECWEKNFSQCQFVQIKIVNEENQNYLSDVMCNTILRTGTTRRRNAF